MWCEKWCLKLWKYFPCFWPIQFTPKALCLQKSFIHNVYIFRQYSPQHLISAVDQSDRILHIQLLTVTRISICSVVFRVYQIITSYPSTSSDLSYSYVVNILQKTGNRVDDHSYESDWNIFMELIRRQRHFCVKELMFFIKTKIYKCFTKKLIYYLTQMRYMPVLWFTMKDWWSRNSFAAW